jgi:CSLREA domain-containing protein
MRAFMNLTRLTPSLSFRIRRRRAIWQLATLALVVTAVPLALYVRVKSENYVAAKFAAANSVGIKAPKVQVTVQAAGRGNTYLNLKDGRQMALAYRGGSSAVSALQNGVASSRTLAVADLDGDGAPDLVAGYANGGTGIVTVQKGNPEGYAPKDDSVLQRMQQGYNPPSLLSTVDTFQVSSPVDFLQLGDFNQDGRKDVLIASRDGNLRLLPGDGQGGFGPEQLISLPGSVTSLTAGEFRAADGRLDVAVGISGAQGSEVLVFDGASGGLAGEPFHFAVPGRAVSVEFGELDSDPFMDLAIGDGDQVNIVHGWGRKLAADPSAQVERIPVAAGVQSLAVDNFTWDRQGTREIAVLGEDGAVHMLENSRSDKRALTATDIQARAAARGQVNKRNEDVEGMRGWSTGTPGSWSDISQVALDARSVSGGAAQGLLTHAKISSGQTNALMVLNEAQRKLEVLHQVGSKTVTSKRGTLSASATTDVSTTSLDVSGTPVASITMPKKLNGSRDIVVLTQESANAVFVPIEPSATFTVNTTSDHAPDGACNASPDCTLREAVIAANSTAGPDTISLPAGTYNLTIIGNTNNAGAGEGFSGNPAIGDLDFRDTVDDPSPGTIAGTGDATTVLGAGSGTTFIIQTTANDRVIEPNPNGDLNFDWTISGVTIAGGRDTGGAATGGGGAFLSGSKDNTTTVTNCVIANNRALGSGGSGGGGISNQGGTVTITNTVFGGTVSAAACPSQTATNCGNSTAASGGGIGYSPGDPFGRTPSSGNLIIQTTSSFQNNAAASLTAGGAGADFYTSNLGTGSVTVSGTTFSNNAATGTASGGGMIIESIGTTISTTSFTNNSAGNRGGGIQVAGGSLLLDGTGPSITFSGNTATTAGSSISASSSVNVSGTNTTIGGDLEITTNGVWTNNTGSTISPNNLIIIGTGSFTANNSTTNVSGNFQFQSGTFNAGTGLFNFNGSGTQTINNSAAITFNNLTDSNVTNPLTINNNIAVNGTLNVNGANATLNPVAATIISGSGTLTGTGVVRVTRTAATADFLSQYTITNKTLTTLLVDYVGASAQVLSSISYPGGLRINNASGVTSAAGTATVDGVLTLTNGALNVNTSTLVLNNTTSVGSGSITSAATGTVNFNQGTAGQNVPAFNYGNLTFSNQNKVLANSGTIGIAGTFTPGTASGHTITGSTINFNGSAAQTIPAFNYNNLTSSNTGGRTLANTGTVGVAGAFTPGTNVFTITGSTIDYNGGSAQTITAFNYNNLTSSNSGGRTLANSGTIGVANVFTPGSNTYIITGSTINFNGAGAQNIPAFNYNNLISSNTGARTLPNGGTVGIAGGFNPGTNVFTNTGSTIDYNGSIPQTITAFNYNNLTSSNTGARTLANAGTIGVASVFTPGTNAYTITGSTVDFNGSGAQTIPAFNFNNLTSSNTGARTLASSGSIGIAGVFTPGTNVYTITGSTVIFNGTSPQTLPSGFTTYNNLTLNNTAGVTGFAGLTVNGLVRVQAGTFTSSSTYNNVQIDSGATLAGVAATTINVSGNWTNNGTFTANNNTVNFNGAGAQVIGGSSATTFQNLTIANAGSGVSLGQNANVNGVLTLTNDLTTAANVLTMPASGSSTGTADVIGNVKRLGFTGGGSALSFGNPFNSIAFAVGGTLPTDVTVNLVKAAPVSGVALPVSVQRTYTITPTGGSGFSSTLRLHYLDTELNTNSEAGLGLWRLGGAGWSRQGKTNSDTSNNWVELSGVTQFSPWTLSADKNNTTTTITQDTPDPSTPNVAFDVFFTVVPNVTGGVTPTGTVNVTVSGGSETCSGTVATGKCTLTLTSAGANRTITATYVGDANSIGSSDTESHTACGSTLVTSTADTGAGSLRQVIADACDATKITFDTAGAFATPQTITLTSGEIVIGKNLTIQAPTTAANKVTISGNNASRVFNIGSGSVVSLLNLTLTGGSGAADGGAVTNNGTLSIVNSTLTGNTSFTDGGAVSNSVTATSLTLINTTISGNNANGNGGGVAVLGGSMTSINSTITNNFADNDNSSTGTGGGIAGNSTTTLKNTIVAGNFNEDGASDAADDISGTIDAASSFNLIGTGGAGGLTNGGNSNQVGVANPGLGPLADNGGPTQTHGLLSTSVAIETGSNANLPADTFDLDGDANVAEPLPVDQRGSVFPRVADSADANITQTVDIGAFELHPSIEDIANQTTSESTVKNVSFNIGDDTGTLITGAGGSVQATSSNTTLVPNANLLITGSGGSRNLQITPVTNQNGTTTITVTVTATNGRTATDTFDLQVASVNNPPAGTDNTVSTAEDNAYTFAAIDFGFTDPNDSPANNLLAVKITTLPSLGTLTNNNIAVNAGDSIPVANINGGLLKFTPVTDGNGTPYTTFTFQVQDDGGGSDIDPTPNTMTINVTAVNDAPVNTVPGPQSTNQDTPKVFSSGNANQISVADVDLGGGQIKITLTGTNGTITLSTIAGLSFTTGDGTDDATMVFTGTLSAVNTAMNGMSFNPTTGFSGAASLQITSDDQGNSGSGGALTDTDSVNITVGPPSAAPVLTATAGNLAYTENAGPVAIDTGLTVTDSDSANLTGATVAITAGFVSAEDTLAFVNQLGITGSYNSGTGVLTLSGTTTVANYQTALRSVTYQNGSDNPTTPRTITFSATDGSSTGQATRGITITAVNDAPVNTVPAPQTTNEDVAKVFSSGNSNQISVNDVDLGANAIKITLTATNGTLTLSTTAGLSFLTGDGTDDATMIFTGSLSAVNTALNGMSFKPNTDFNGAASLQIVSDDQGSTGTGGPLTDTDSVNITVTAQNDAPVVTATAGNLSYTENAGAVAIDPGLTVTDVDSANLTGASVAITAGFVSADDTLAFTNQLGITGSYNSGTGVLTLSGTTTVANYQTALRSVTYQNGSENPTASRTITFTANDGTDTGTATRGIAITAVNDAPVNTVPAPQTTAQDTAKVFSAINSNQISVADVDLGANPIKITLTATNGTLTLSTIAGLSFTSGDGTADASMIFTGSLSAVNTALNGMSFNPTSGFNGAASLQIVSDDQGNTGTGGALTDTDSVNITVTAPNAAPVVTTTAGNLSYTENAAATAIDPGLTVSDSDTANLVGATVAITGNFASGEDVLAFVNQLGITGSYNSGTGVLTLTGTTSVANYQTALRSVTYQNSSDNPSTALRTVTFTADDGITPGGATRGIAVTAVNDAPVNVVPGPQSTGQNTPLTFSSGSGSLVAVSDVDAGTNSVQVTLTVTNGTLTLNGTSGLAFTVGDGTADATMTFTGSIANINAAMNGMTYTPTAGFSGSSSLTITTSDQGNTGTGGALSDTDVVSIQVGVTNVSIANSQLTEPSSGSANMVFTVTLSAPASAAGASVDFTTQQQAPALNHATAGQDYTTTTGTLTFGQGQQIKSISVPILADNKKAEANESFLVVLSNPVNVSITNGTATGTILITDTPGAILITEVRTSGPAGAGDDFVEIYNNSSSPHTVNDGSGINDAAHGYGLYKMGADCNANPILIGVIPNGTVIPGRGHYLFVGSAYSLANYGGTGAAAGDQVLSQDIEDDRNVAIFNTTSLLNLSTLTRLDAVGFGDNTGAACDLLREGATLAPLSGSVLEYSYFRDECGKKGNPATFGNCPSNGFEMDTNVNQDDFIFADTSAAMTPAGQRLGAPGPQNLGNPRMNLSIATLLLDATKGSTTDPNRVRDTTPQGPLATQGTLSVRRRFVNNTGAPVTRLRFRIVDFSAFPVSGATADLRALSSSNITVTGIKDSATCASTGTPTSQPCTVTVFGTALETPPTQALGGALNSSYNAGTISLSTPLAPGQSINLQFLLGVQKTGSFKFFLNIESLP